jgi:hypothetical protein
VLKRRTRAETLNLLTRPDVPNAHCGRVSLSLRYHKYFFVGRDFFPDRPTEKSSLMSEPTREDDKTSIEFR